MTTELLGAFALVRAAAEDHMDECDGLGLGWAEEAVTDVAAHKGEPTVHFVPFHKTQEGKGVCGGGWTRRRARPSGCSCRPRC